MVSTRILPFIVVSLATAPAAATAQAPAPQAAAGSRAQASQTPASCPAPEARQFDFWIGEWNVRNRQSPPANPGRWYDTGTATDRVYPVVDGCAIIEHWRGTVFQGFVTGFSVRAWNADSGVWDLVLLWPSPGQPRFGELHGTFRHGRGEFLARRATPAGDTTVTRFSFADITPSSLRWQSETSNDAGASWSSTWIMEFSRRDPVRDDGLWNGPAMTTDRCPDDVHRTFDARLGEWTGRRIAGGGEPTEVRGEAIRILEGCAILERVWAVDRAWESMTVRAWEPDPGHWVQYTLRTDDPTLRRWEAPAADQPFTLVTAGAGSARMTARDSANAWGWTREARDGAGAWATVEQVRLAERVAR